MSNQERKLAYYYMHTSEWWGQAIWFYNKMNNSSLPDLWAAVENAESYAAVPQEIDDYARLVMDYWDENHRLAELMLPEN